MKKLTNKEAIEKFQLIHNDNYDYSKVKYINCYTKVIITCKIHGDFPAMPHHHWSGSRCRLCTDELYSKRFRKSTQQFILDAKKIHGNKYDYNLVDYKNKSTKIDIICKKHGKFNQRADSHLEGYGCSKCKETFGEREIRKILEIYNIKFISQFSFIDCKKIKPLLFDFYIPDINLCIEYNGKQHYEQNHFFTSIKGFEDMQERDEIKINYCKNNKINLLIIRFDENISEKLLSYLETW